MGNVLKNNKLFQRPKFTGNEVKTTKKFWHVGITQGTYFGQVTGIKNMEEELRKIKEERDQVLEDWQHLF